MRHNQAAERYNIGLYRDVWIAAIVSSRKSLATQTAAICVRFHGRRVRHVYVTMQITFLARKSALIYRRGLRQRVASLTIDCNGVFAIRAYSAVAQLVECRTRNRDSPGSNPRCYRFEVWAFSFTSRRLSRLSCINEYLATDSGGNVSE